MAIIYTYPQKASVEATDTFLITDSSDNQTKTVTASAIASYIDDEVDLQEVLAKGNTATNNINLTGNYNGTGNITASGTFSLGGNATLTGAGSQVITKTTGDLNVFAAAGDAKLRSSGATNKVILQSDFDIDIEAPTGTIDIDAVNIDIDCTDFRVDAPTVDIGSDNTGYVRITGGSGGNGFYPAAITDNWNFNGIVTFNQPLIDRAGSTGGSGQALFAIAGGKVEWTTVQAQALAANQIFAGNVSGIPTATGLITANAVTGNVTIGVAGSQVTVADKLIIPITPPATATSTGTRGEIIAGNDGYIYICTASNTWVRALASTF